jgi:Tol biopolymer transport system component
MDTALGAIMGTAAYMSPEQARGKRVDRRTDVWAFGCCLYEALTGKRAFQGETSPDILSAVLSKEVDWGNIPLSTPRRVRDLLARALRKDANLRLQHIGDARVELLDSQQEPGDEELVKNRRWYWLAATAFISIVGGFLLRSAFEPPSLEPDLPPKIHFRVEVPERHQLVVQRGRGSSLGRYPPVAISRNGDHFVFAAKDENGISRLYLRALDALDAHVLPGTEEAELPFFSHDGKWLGFLVGNHISKVSIYGGTPVAVGNTPFSSARGAAWTSEDTILLGGHNTALVQMDALTGVTEPLTQLNDEREENYHAWPFALPDNEHVLFTVFTAAGNSDLAVVSLATGKWRLLEQTTGATQAHYLDSGHLVFFRPGGLFAAPFNLSDLEIEGQATTVPLGDLVEGWDAGLDLGYFAASASGALVFVPGSVDLQQSLIVQVDRRGRSEPLTKTGRYHTRPALSPDGTRLVAADTIQQSRESDSDLFLQGLERQSRTRLTPDGASIYPGWSGDGKSIFFSRFGKGGDSDLYSLPADGSGTLERLVDRPYDQSPSDASRDGRLLAFKELHPLTGYDVHLLSLGGDHASTPFAVSTANERDASFSPDNRFIAYVSDETGRYEIHVRPLSGSSGKTVVSTNGGRWPRWSPLGDELFYMEGTTLMAAPVTLEPSFRPDTPRPLFEGNYSMWFDVFPDGQSFAMITYPDADLRELEVVVNWSTEISELVPKR